MNGAVDLAGIPGTNVAFDGDEQTWYMNIGKLNKDSMGLNDAVGICRPEQGAAATERIGRKICMKSLVMRWCFREADIAAGDNMGPGLGARIMVILDTQANGTLPKQTDFFDASGLNTKTASDDDKGGIEATQLNQNIENSQRFKILLDKICKIPQSATTLTYDEGDTHQGSQLQRKCTYWSKFLRLPNVEIELAGDSGNPTTCKSNAVHILVKPIGGKIYISGNFRSRFTDV